MSASNEQILKQYMTLTEFLGKVLGPNYEIVLHDLTDKNHSVIAIANNHISGRTVGAPLTNTALSTLKGRSYEASDYSVDDHGLSISGKEIRSNTLYIKHEGKMIGMLCVNFDGSKYRDVAKELLSLVYPDSFAEELKLREENTEGILPGSAGRTESFSHSSEDVAEDAVAKELSSRGLTAERLTPGERLEIISSLEADGIFLLKGTIRKVAAALGCSQPSVYRYLSRIRDKKTD